jgi:hypothetical protein
MKAPDKAIEDFSRALELSPGDAARLASHICLDLKKSRLNQLPI